MEIINKNIGEYVVGEKVDSILVIKRINLKTTNTGDKKFLDFTLSDKTGEINAKLWDVPESLENKFTESDLIKIRGTVTSYMNAPQLKIDRIRFVDDNDNIVAKDFVKTAPFDNDEMFDLLVSYIDRIENKYIKEITYNLVMEKEEEIMYYPAAKSFHHSIEGGLLYHLTTMLRVADSIGRIYDAVNTDLLFAGVILHDLEKINEMDSTELGIIKEYTFEGTLLGHITMGIKNLEKEAEKLGTPDEIKVMLQHMILSHHMEPEYGSPKKPVFLEAEILHHIDTMDARIYDFVNAVENINPGEFSERVWTLDNRNIYKPKFDK